MSEPTSQITDRLLLLFILSRIESPVNGLQLSSIVLENKLMNYFLYQELLNKLIDSGFISQTSSEGMHIYTITESGKSSLSYFYDRLPETTTELINQQLPAIKSRIMEQNLIKTHITQEASGFLVQCSIRENHFTLFDIKIGVGTRQDAQRISNNFKQQSESYYQKILRMMLLDETDSDKI
jgi:predicted transcriptional regulator